MTSSRTIIVVPLLLCLLSMAGFAQPYIVTTIAGGGSAPVYGPLNASSAIGLVNNIAVDANGSVYIASLDNHRIYRAGPDGILAVFAGTGAVGFAGDNGSAVNANLNMPTAVAVDRSGNVYIADSGNGRIRKVTGGVISTIAGTGSYGFSGDGGPAVAASLSTVSGIAVATDGTVYFADSGNQRVRKIAGGVITTVAGNGTNGFSGDNGLAISAQLNWPSGVALDASGNLFIADQSNYRVREVSGGIISTFAGNGNFGSSGDNGPAVNASLVPRAVAVDSSGSVYIVDAASSRIRKVTNGTITAAAGGGIGCPQQTNVIGDGCPALSAILNGPTSVAIGRTGDIYIADSSNYRVRKISGGIASTVAGNGSWRYSGDGGLAIRAQFDAASVAVLSPGNYVIADAADYRVRSVSGGFITTLAGTGACCYNGDNIPAASASVNVAGVAADSLANVYTAESNYVRKISAGTIQVLAGNGTGGFSGDNGPATAARIFGARSIAADNSGNVYISDQFNNRVRKVSSSGIITTVAGGGPADGSSATAVSMPQPVAIAVDSAGNAYVPSASHNRVYKISTTGALTIIAGDGTSGYSGDNGPATSAQLSGPYSVAVNPAGTVVYIADRNNQRVRMVSGGIITTVAGGGAGCPQQTDGVGDGCLGTDGILKFPSSLAFDSTRSVLYIADALNYRIRKLSGGVITTVAGNGTCCYSGDNGPATSAQLNYAAAIAVSDSTGDLYIGDSENYRVRRVSAGVITTVAGTGVYGYAGDNGPATSAQLSYSYGVAVDSAGAVYIADAANSRVRKIAGGVIATVAGNGVAGYSGDGSLAINGQIRNPYGVAVDSAGSLYIADTDNARVRKVSGGVINTIGGNGSTSYSGDGGPAASAQLASPSSIAVDNAGNVYIADGGNYRIRQVAPNGVITTIAGNGSPSYSGDNGPAAAAGIGYVTAIATDTSGNVLLIDPSSGPRVRRISGGIITTIAGNGMSGYSGDGGPATAASFSNPQGIAVDALGNIYIADTGNMRIRLLTTSPRAITSTQPSSAVVGSTAFTLQVNGMGFVNGDVVEWNGTPLTTTFVNSGRLNAQVTASQLAQISTAAVTVNGLSNPAAFDVVPVVPYAPILSSPANGATGIPMSAALNWYPSLGAASYDVYFGTTPSPPFVANTTAPTFSPAGLHAGVTYYWYITARNNSSGAATSATWSFKTQSNAQSDFNGDGIPDLIWQNDSTRGVTVNYYGGPGGATYQGWNWLNAGALGWHVVAVADFNGDGQPDLVWQNDSTRAVTVHYYGGPGGATYQGWNWLHSGAAGWRVVALADFNGDGQPDLVWQNDADRTVTVHYYGGTGGATYQGWSWLYGAAPGWHVAMASDFNGDGVPDVVWQNDTDRSVTVHYYGGSGGAVDQGWNWLSSGAPGWSLVNSVR